MRAIARLATRLFAVALLGLPAVSLAHGGHGHGKHHDRWTEHHDRHGWGIHDQRHHHFSRHHRRHHRHVDVVPVPAYAPPVVYRPYRPSVVIHVPPVVIPF